MSFSRGLRGCESIASAAPAPTGPWQAQVAERRGCSCKASYAKSMLCPSASVRNVADGPTPPEPNGRGGLRPLGSLIAVPASADMQKSTHE